MKKVVLIILLCGVMFFSLIGCGQNDEHSFLGKVVEVAPSYIIVEPNEDEEVRKSSDRFRINMIDPGFYLGVGDFVKVTYTGSIKESYPAQIEMNDVEKLSPITFNDNFKVERYSAYDTIKYYPYYKNDERTIFFAGDIKEFYIIEGKDTSLNEYITTTYQTFDDGIKHIIEKLDKVAILKDGGTAIYKSKDLDLTITVCNTLDDNRDIYFDNYESEFQETMCK